MKGLVIDFETNGFRGASVLSVAAIKIVANWDAGTVRTIETFVRHYHPVEKWNRFAQAVNRLSAPIIASLRDGATYPTHFRDDPALGSFASDVVFAVAHNAAFDSHFANLPVPWICTMKLAGGKLAEAACVRGIEVDQTRLHQAFYDTEVCLALFSQLLREQKVPRPVRDLR